MFCRFKIDKDIDIVHESDDEDECLSLKPFTNVNTVGFKVPDNNIDEVSDDWYFQKYKR